jgi:NAD(P)-dependent dehydrogenase (short-subunit alcohol dehydrogenase family)
MAEQRSPGAEHMFGQPIDIAMTVRFLVSKPARFWTGQVVCLNGS